MADDNAGLVEALETETRRDMLSEQFDAVEAENVSHETVEKPAVERVRAPDGKFAGGVVAKPAPAVTPDPTVQEPVWKRPPASWKKDYHEVWATADDKLKEYAHQREMEMKTGVQPLVEKARFADAMQEVIAPYMQTIRGLGATPQTAVRALMAADHKLRTSSPQEKVAYFRQLADQYGVDIGQVAQQPGQPIDQNYHALANQLNMVRGEVMSWKEQQEQQQNATLLTEIEQFAADPKNTHFEDARPTMVRLLQTGEADTLADAYRKALRLDDGLFALSQAALQAESLKSTVAAKDRAAKQARSAAVSVKSSTPGTHTAPKAQDRRSMLSEQFGGLSDRL